MPNTTKLTQTTGATTELIRKPELAKKLKLCTRKVEQMVNAGEIPAIKIGTSVRYNWDRVLEALENNHPN